MTYPQTPSSSNTTSTTTMTTTKSKFLSLVLSSSILRLQNFTLKSGRASPYYFDAGSFHRADLLHEISLAYARTIIDYATANPSFHFDVLFGPAYKGIPLAVAVVAQLAILQPEKYGRLSYSFNRKEKKDHGEGGSIVGSEIKGKRILVIDDVITAGTAIRETIEIIKQQRGRLVGIIVALDRQERMALGDMTPGGSERLSELSAIGQLNQDLGIPVMSILMLDDIFEYVTTHMAEDQIVSFKAYWERYRAGS